MQERTMAGPQYTVLLRPLLLYRRQLLQNRPHTILLNRNLPLRIPDHDLPLPPHGELVRFEPPQTAAALVDRELGVGGWVRGWLYPTLPHVEVSVVVGGGSSVGWEVVPRYRVSLVRSALEQWEWGVGSEGGGCGWRSVVVTRDVEIGNGEGRRCVRAAEDETGHDCREECQLVRHRGGGGRGELFV